jgi:hemolysin III
VRSLSLSERVQTLGEEIANSVSHGVGALIAAAAAVFLIVARVQDGDPIRIAGASIFGFTMVFVYTMSTLYHGLTRTRAQRVFRILDHSAIYLLIAGTYTPFTLGVLRGAWGWSLFGVIWGLAILGVVLTAILGVRFPTLSTTVYVAMGWLFVVGIKPLVDNMAPWGIFWLVAGGVFYTGGVAFFAARRLRYHHMVWHFFVMAGTVCHYVAVLHYAG